MRIAEFGMRNDYWRAERRGTSRMRNSECGLRNRRVNGALNADSGIDGRVVRGPRSNVRGLLTADY